jgi:DNA-binding XRE family transcriptional regulator
MNNLIPIEYQGQRILTTAQLAESYGTDNKHISENYSNNASRYTEGKHFFKLEGEELARFKEGYPKIPDSLKFTSILYLWPEKGAWLHAKSLLRQIQNLTQEELAGKVGISTSYLSRLEQGAEAAHVKTLSRIAECLGVELVKLLEDLEQ